LFDGLTPRKPALGLASKRKDNSAIIRDATSMNSFNQYTQYNSGNSLTTTKTYDCLGMLRGITTGSIQYLGYSFDEETCNLIARKDNSLIEIFSYDNLGRLTEASGPAPLSMNFANNGNITNKTSVGDYTYSTMPHAVTGVTNPNGLISTAAQRLTYTSFNKADSIIQGNYVYTLQYGYNDQRTISQLFRNDTLQKTVYYAGAYEKEVVPGSYDKEIHYIYGGDGLAAICVISSGRYWYYVHKDHLGSLNKVTNSSGAVIQNTSFDAWGRRRNPTNWTYSNIPSTTFSRGYTGHEHLDLFDLINMNGRMYDPVLGRFFSPDNFVQSPDFTQSFNRYSYCLNNPLVYTDPDGELIWIIPNIGFSRDGGLSFGLSVVVGVPGVWSVQAGVGYNTGYRPGEGSVYGYIGATAAMNTVSASYSTSGGFSLGYSAGATVFSGLPISTNFATVGVNYNFTNNSFSGNISAWQIDQSGMRFNPSFSMMVFPEQTTNLFRAGKFMNNNELLDYYVSQEKYQKALNKFGFKGTYDPDNEGFYQENPEPAFTNEAGETFYSNAAFKNYDHLYATYDHEMSHRYDILSNETLSLDLIEYNAYMKNHKHEGLYSGHKYTNWISKIRQHGSVIINPLYLQDQAWTPPAWHFIYKFPRRW
jgi:RHS repeat-associated protein